MAMAQPQAQEQEPLLMTEAEYLEFEENSELKHEFVNGRVYTMTGAAVNHNVINSNINTILNSQLYGKPCIVMSSDMRLKVASDSVSYRYPDTIVICGDVKLAEGAGQTVTNPIVVIEVLSPSTALKDYNEKLAEYTQIDTLQDYLLISQYDAKVEVFSREKSGKWVYSLVTGLNANLELSSINCKINLDRLYDKAILRASDNEDQNHIQDA